MNTRNLRWWQLLCAVGLVFMLLLGGVGSAHASDIRSGDLITIGKGEVIDDDLLLFANTIVVDGTVNGDLVALGNSVTLNGTVNGSAVLGGQQLNVSGLVKGTLYSGGSSLYLAPTASIERNMMFGGYSLQTASGSVIGRDLSAAGAQATLGGKVTRDLQFGGNALELNGEIGRNVRAEVSQSNQIPMGAFYGPNMPPAIPSGLRVARDAVIGGQLIYTSQVEQASQILATPEGGVVFKALPVSAQSVTVVNAYEWLFNRLRDLFTVLILGFLALLTIPRWVNAAVTHAQTKPLGATGWGLLVLIGGFVAAFVVFVAIVLIGIVLGLTTLGGLTVAIFGVGFSGLTLLLTVFTALVVWGTKVIVACLIGKLLLQQFAKAYADNAFIAFTIGLVLFEIVAAIPFLGVVVTFFTVLLGLGAMWYVYYERRRALPLSMPNPAPLPA